MKKDKVKLLLYFFKKNGHLIFPITIEIRSIKCYKREFIIRKSSFLRYFSRHRPEKKLIGKIADISKITAVPGKDRKTMGSSIPDDYCPKRI